MGKLNGVNGGPVHCTRLNSEIEWFLHKSEWGACMRLNGEIEWGEWGPCMRLNGEIGTIPAQV